MNKISSFKSNSDILIFKWKRFLCARWQTEWRCIASRIRAIVFSSRFFRALLRSRWFMQHTSQYENVLSRRRWTLGNSVWITWRNVE
jgi:hypothetical protein